MFLSGGGGECGGTLLPQFHHKYSNTSCQSVSYRFRGLLVKSKHRDAPVGGLDGNIYLLHRPRKNEICKERQLLCEYCISMIVVVDSREKNRMYSMCKYLFLVFVSVRIPLAKKIIFLLKQMAQTKKTRYLLFFFFSFLLE